MLTLVIKASIMKKSIILTSLIVLMISIVSCSKDKPPTGNYIGVFHYEYPSTWPDKSIWFKVEESKKDFFILTTTDYNGNVLVGYDTIFKNENKINGHISSIDGLTYQITGKLSKKSFNKYFLKGAFTQLDYTAIGPNAYSGTFEIKSN